jgi:hypothetical protein
MTANIFKFNAEVWLYPGKAAWHFITVPESLVDDINLYSHKKRGWGSLRVVAKIQNYSWNTSIFPDKNSGSYLLPLKASVRQSLCINEGDNVQTEIEII